MKKNNILTAALLCAALLLSSCKNEPANASETEKTAPENSSASAEESGAAVKSSSEYSAGELFSGGKIKIGGTYTLSGEVSPVTVNAGNGDVTLILDGAKITAENEPAIYVKEAGSVTVIAKDGSESVLSCSVSGDSDASKNKISAAIFSKSPLIFEGAGKISAVSENGTALRCQSMLTVKSSVLSLTADNDGISAESAFFLGGDVTVTAGGGCKNGKQHAEDFGRKNNDTKISSESESGTSSKGIKADISVSVSGGNITVDSADDSIHTNGTLTVDGGAITVLSGDDAFHADSELIINGGTLTASECYEGLEAKSITVNGGMMTLNCSDDGLNACSGDGTDTFMRGDDSSLTINGGDIFITVNGDGLDCNGAIVMNGGNVVITGPTNAGNGAIDFDGSFEINGGTLAASGASGMAQAPGGGTVNTISITANIIDCAVTVKDSSGSAVFTHTPARSCQSLVLSSPEFKTGETYTVYAGDTELGTVTISSAVSYIGEGGFGGFGGGRPDGGFGKGGFKGGNSGDGENGADSGFRGGRGDKFPGFGDNNGETPDFPRDGDFPDFPQDKNA